MRPLFNADHLEHLFAPCFHSVVFVPSGFLWLLLIASLKLKKQRKKKKNSKPGSYLAGMATTEVVSPFMAETYPDIEPVLEALSTHPPSTDDFDPKKHIVFTPPANIMTMSDLKLPEGTGVSPFAVSDPFQLFTQEAVQRMRAEIFRKEVLKNCKYSSNLAQCQLRGYAAK